MKHHLVTFALLPIAVGLYGAGYGHGASVLVVLGMACELSFWYRIIRSRSDPALIKRSA